MRRVLRGLAALVLALGTVSVARAHPVVVDGDATEWFATPLAGVNVGRLQRNAAGHGEIVFVDANDDARNDLATGMTGEIADLREVRLTADATNLYFLVTLDGTMDGANPPMIQIALDLDRTAGSGARFFAGFADLQTSNDAAFEWLVRTRSPGGGPVRLDVVSQTYATTEGAGTIAVDAASARFEMAVPWSALGLVAPPAAFRFSVATFREDVGSGNAINLGDGTITNALDLLTDYADQPGATGLFTWPNEVNASDIVLDHFNEVWLTSAGEPRSPIVISRVHRASAAPDADWFELVNVSAGSVDLLGFKAGDEEALGGTESMRRLPTLSLGNGEAAIFADQTTRFQDFYGSAPEAQMQGLTSFGAWVSGNNFDLAGNDEVVLLGPDNLVLDVAVWGTGVFPGVTALGALGTVQVAVRTPVTLDTDQGGDFAVRPLCHATLACTGGVCASCQRFACIPATVGTSCADTNLCNGEETCDGNGACAAGPELDCDDGSACTNDDCTPLTGCSNVAITCPDDGNPCTVPLCNAATGCGFANVMDGTSCDDANACTSSTVCMAGSCEPMMGTTCADDGNPCTVERCDAALGCVSEPVGNGTACDDGDQCTLGSTCTAGACGGGSAVFCPGDGNPCTAESCDSATGCGSTPVANGTSCDDGNACTSSTTCTAGACGGGSAIDCPDDANPCTAPLCNPATGTCGFTNVADGTGCDDGNPCTTATVCGAGACGGGGATTCADDGNPCTVEMCDPASGCGSMPAADGASCDDSDACTTGETCTSGTCSGGAAVTCTDDGNPCTVELCTPATGCGTTNVADGMACDDGDPCTESDECMAGTCDGSPVPACMVDAGPMDAGLEDAGLEDGGVDDGGLDDGGFEDDSSVPADSGTGTDAGRDAGRRDAGADAGEGGASGGGCNCRTDGGDDARFAWLALGLVAFARRRRR